MKLFSSKKQKNKDVTTESDIPKSFPLNEDEPFETALMRTAETERKRTREAFKKALEDEYTEEEIDRIKSPVIETTEDAAVQVITAMMMEYPEPENVEISEIPYLNPVWVSPGDAQISIMFTSLLVFYLNDFLDSENEIKLSNVVARTGFNILTFYPAETQKHIILIGLESFQTYLKSLAKNQEDYDDHEKKMDRLKFAIWAFVKSADRGVLQIITNYYIPFFNDFKDIKNNRTSS